MAADSVYPIRMTSLGLHGIQKLNSPVSAGGRR
jgi:hypothetical protein